jgi:acyl phosphate:glycerol-3-phosphate acyltransferase
MKILTILLPCSLGFYLIGAIPFSIIIAKLKGVNLLEVGSKNAGATNVYRNVGLPYAILAFLLDFAKGYIACYLAVIYCDNPTFTTAAAFSVIIGHVYSPFLKFKGGKGAATALGIILFMKPEFLLITSILAFLIIYITRYVSLATIINSLLILILAHIPYFNLHFQYKVFFTVTSIFVIIKHKDNLIRLLKGEENKV